MSRSFSNIIALSSFAMLSLLVACGSQGQQTGPRQSTAQRPVGSADAAGDQADTTCRVVLRSVARPKNGPGYETTCSGGHSTGPCLFVWRGAIEVSTDAAKSHTVHLLYKTNLTNGQWYAIDAKASKDPATAGFVRYEFEINKHTPAEGQSMTSLMRTTLSMIPYLKNQAGGRIFDHNRVADPLGAYELHKDNSWEIGEDTAVCPAQQQSNTPTYVLDYPGFGETLKDGPVVAGGKLTVDYDARRLRETQSCLGSQAAASSTTIVMGYFFDSDTTVRTETVETYVERYGYACPGTSPCIDITKSTPTLAVPADAKSVSMWFYCVPGFSQGAPGNWKYDSNFGKNYVVSVVAGAGKKVDWAGRWQVRYSRSGFVEALPEPFVYTGFSNLDPTIQAHVYVKGITDQPTVDTNKLKAYVETDLIGCKAGGALQRAELQMVASHQGDYGNDSLFRWGMQATAMRCPKGSYRYRFLFSADGGQTFTALGNAASTADANADSFRQFLHQ
jgi:hypothetical protein